MRRWMALLCLLTLLAGCAAQPAGKNVPQGKENGTQSAENGTETSENGTETSEKMSENGGPSGTEVQTAGNESAETAASGASSEEGNGVSAADYAVYAAGNLSFRVPVPDGWCCRIRAWRDTPDSSAETSAADGESGTAAASVGGDGTAATAENDASGTQAALIDDEAGSKNSTENGRNIAQNGQNAAEYAMEWDETGTPGITFWPEAEPAFQVTLSCWLDGFGMCGTGVEFQEITLKNGETATLATQTGGDETWYTLIYHGVPGSYVAQWNGDAAALAVYEETIFDMLGMAELGCDSLPETVITAQAAAACGQDAADAICRFDVREGIWNVWFYTETGSTQVVTVTPAGAVGTVRTEQE